MMKPLISKSGEMELDISGNKFFLKCTFRGLDEMETRACMGQGGLSFRFISKTIGIRDLTSIIYGGIIGKISQDKKPPVTFEELGELILQHGFNQLIPACEEYLLYAMTGGKQDDIVVKKKVSKG